jgi:paraquat-inducible protein B
MADEIDPNAVPQATVVRKKRTRVSIVWIIPILAAIVAIGIGVQRILSEGPTIYIIFKSAQGIEAGKTFIKYKDVNIGQVTAVELSENYGRVVVKAKVAKHAGGLMVADAKFWVVEPRISLSGISGLNTLLSGNYIGFQAGTSTESQRSFIGLDTPPAVTDQKGRKFALKAPTVGSLGVGSPIYYRQLAVGRVTNISLAPDGKSVEVGIFIESPYDRYVTYETRFWNASGMDITLGADGVDVHTESLAALIAGGIAYDLPSFVTGGAEVAEDTVFTLYPTQAVAMKQPDPVERRFVLHFNESVRGLSVGAPVVLYGLPVGEVTSVGLDFDRATAMFRPRVLITFLPDRVVDQMSQQQKAGAAKSLTALSAEERLRLLRRVVEEKGLRAQLRTGSLITGEMYVAFEYFPNAPKVRLDATRDPIELPVVPGGLAALESKLGSILAKIDNMPLDAIGVDVKNAIETLTTTLKDADTLIKRVDVQWVPEGTKTLQALHQAITDADRALVNADTTFFGKDSPAPQDLRDTLQEVTRAARAVRILVDYLERHPEMLIRGKAEGSK